MRGCPLPCWLLKLRKIGTYGVKMKEGPSLVGSLGSSSRHKRFFILPWLLWSAQYKIFFLSPTLFQIMCPHRPATWAGSLAGLPVSEWCVSGPTYNCALPVRSHRNRNRYTKKLKTQMHIFSGALLWIEIRLHLIRARCVRAHRHV